MTQTATARESDPHRPTPSASTLRPVFWLALYLALVLAPLVLLLATATPQGAGFWWEMSIALGFAALVMMAIQFLLTARFKRATAPFGIDLIYYFHRYLAYVLLAVVVAHPVILVLMNPAMLRAMNPLDASWQLNAGTASLVALLLLVVTSAWRRPLAIPYERWRFVHLILSVVSIALGLVHAFGVDRYTSIPIVRWAWIAVGIALTALVAWVRVMRPWQLKRAPYRVAAVTPERGDSWTLEVAPDGHRGFTFRPGQFAWITLRSSPFAMREHPFSIASAPRPDGRLDFAIKELGDFTSTIGTIEVGERCWVDGPYGSFSIDHRPAAPGYVFIAGGIGIAPMLGMLRTLAERGDTRPHILIAGHSSWDRIPLRERVDEVAEEIDLRVVRVLEEPEAGWEGESGWITEELLERHLPDNREHLDYFVCGPIPLIRLVESSLDALGVPSARVHTELFDIA